MPVLDTSKPPAIFRLVEAYPTDFEGSSAFAWYVQYEADGVANAEKIEGNWNPYITSQLKKQRDRALKSMKTSKNETGFLVDQWIFYSTLRKGAKEAKSTNIVLASSRARHVATALVLETKEKLR